MSALKVSAIRQRLAAHLAAGLTGWRESKYSADFFGVDGKNPGPLAFAVGAPGTGSYQGPGQDRQRLTEGTLTSTILVVKSSHRLRDDSHLADYDAALDAEQLLVARAMTMDQTDLEFRWLPSASRQSQANGQWLLIETLFRVDHRYPLT